MILHDQTTFSDPDAGTHGDCARACIATILQIEPMILPHPIAEDGGWSGGFTKALRGLGWCYRSATYDARTAKHPDLYDPSWGDFILPRLVMAAGPSPRGSWLHAVVWDRIAGKMIHDPHPSRDGLSAIAALDYLAPYPKQESDQ